MKPQTTSSLGWTERKSRDLPLGRVAKQAVPFRVLVGMAVALALGVGCGAVFPELSTPVRKVPPGFVFNPAPPTDLLYVAFARAVIPPKTRDGRAWDSVGGSLPDVFAKLIVDKKEIIVTPIESNTLSPTWPNQTLGNYRIPPDAGIWVELWDSNPISNHPICSKQLHAMHEQSLVERRMEISCDSGAYLELIVEPAHGKVGMGFNYEIRTDQVFITRVLGESPAARAGLQRGEEVTAIMGQPVVSLSEGQVRSLINANGGAGLRLTLRAKDSTGREVTLRDGPIFESLDEASR